MKGFVYDRYGSANVLRWENLPQPLPAAGEVLINVRAAALNPLDWHYMRGTPYGLRLGTAAQESALRDRRGRSSDCH